MRIRTPCAWFGIKLLSQEHPDVNWRRVGDSNSCALAVRQFSGLLGYQLPIPSAC